MEKVIFGFVGLLSSGKGTAAAYLKEKHTAQVFRFSTMLRDLLSRLYLEHSRANMQTISDGIRTMFGEDIMASVIAKDAAEATSRLVVVDGVRRPADIVHLKALPNFILVEIFADEALRHTRLTTRGENSDDATKTLEQFRADHQKPADALIPMVAQEAVERIDNNGSVESMHAQLDALVKKYAGNN